MVRKGDFGLMSTHLLRIIIGKALSEAGWILYCPLKNGTAVRRYRAPGGIIEFYKGESGGYLEKLASSST